MYILQEYFPNANYSDTFCKEWEFNRKKKADAVNAEEQKFLKKNATKPLLCKYKQHHFIYFLFNFMTNKTPKNGDSTKVSHKEPTYEKNKKAEEELLNTFIGTGSVFIGCNCDISNRRKSEKYSHLYQFIIGETECEEARQMLLSMPTISKPQNVTTSKGDYIQSILWLDCVNEALYELEKLIEQEPTNEDLRSLQTLLNTLGDKMQNNGLQFLFF